VAHWVYIIQSEADGTYYVGSTENVSARLEQHNLGWTRSTKAMRPWKVVHIQECQTKTEAMKRERQIKQMKSRVYIQRLILGAGGRPDP